MIIIVEGIDNCGKSTQIEKIKNYLAKNKISSHVLHYSNYTELTKEENEEMSKRTYGDMFEALTKFNNPGMAFIFDRFHLGEFVYSPRYRGYDGSYVFKDEQKFQLSFLGETAGLILFTDTAENVIARDDGLSFTTNIKNKKEEINDFDIAYEKSCFEDKKRIALEGRNADKVFNESVKPFINILIMEENRKHMNGNNQ